jgi:hypothetical protein
MVKRFPYIVPYKQFLGREKFLPRLARKVKIFSPPQGEVRQVPLYRIQDLFFQFRQRFDFWGAAWVLG